MAESTLINLDQLREQYDVSKNYREDRLNAHIWRAQRNDVKPILGAPLYYDLMENITAPKYVLLVNGGEYDYNGNTIYFQGLQQLTGAYTYSRIVEHNNMFVTAKGNKQKTDNNSQKIEDITTETEGMGARSEAYNIALDVMQFLSNNPTDYPLYKRLNSPRSSFFFQKV